MLLIWVGCSSWLDPYYGLWVFGRSTMFDYLIKVMLAWFLHIKLLIFALVVNKYFCGSLSNDCVSYQTVTNFSIPWGFFFPPELLLSRLQNGDKLKGQQKGKADLYFSIQLRSRKNNSYIYVNNIKASLKRQGLNCIEKDNKFRPSPKV